MQQYQPQSREGALDDKGPLREVRRTEKAVACPSHRWEPPEQRPCQLEDVVRWLPSSLSFAELHGDRLTAEALRTLQQAIREAGSVRDPSVLVQKIWASLSKEAQNRIRLGFDAARWRLVVPFPLVQGAEARVGRLRLYGDAIVVPAAQAFIEAFLEAEQDRKRNKE